MTSMEYKLPNVKSYKNGDLLDNVENNQDFYKTIVERCSLGDPELITFQSQHAFESQQGGINTKMFANLSESQGWAYKIREREEMKLVGVVYAIRKGMEWRAIQIAYFVADAEQRKGYALDAVGQVTEDLRSEYDVVANIEQANTPSEKIVRALGYVSASNDGYITSYFAKKHRQKLKHVT